MAQNNNEVIELIVTVIFKYTVTTLTSLFVFLAWANTKFKEFMQDRRDHNEKVLKQSKELIESVVDAKLHDVWKAIDKQKEASFEDRERLINAIRDYFK